MPVGKELHFFDRNSYYNPGRTSVTSLPYHKIRIGLLQKFGYTGKSLIWNFMVKPFSLSALYLNLFCEKHKTSGDVTPTYGLINEKGVSRVKDLLPDVKLIFILREPVERAWSQYRMKIRDENLKPSSLREDEIISFLSQKPQLRRGRYKETIDMWSEYYTNKNILILTYDLLKYDRILFLKEVLKFLNKDLSNLNNIDVNIISNYSDKVQLSPNVREVLIKIHKEDIEYYKHALSNEKKLLKIE